jgi:hypothetical protein
MRRNVEQKPRSHHEEYACFGAYHAAGGVSTGTRIPRLQQALWGGRKNGANKMGYERNNANKWVAVMQKGVTVTVTVTCNRSLRGGTSK